MGYLDQETIPNPNNLIADPNARIPNPEYVKQQQMMQQQADAQAAKAAMPNPTPTGTNVMGAQVQANTPSIGQPGAPGYVAPPAPGEVVASGPIAYANDGQGPNTSKGYLDPQPLDPQQQSGMWQGAYVKGLQAGQASRLAQNEDNRQNETQTWKRQEVTKKQQIDMGMQKASEIGGFYGVVDYLKTADPDRAIVFQAAKEDLDTRMLTNDKLRMMNKSQQQQALVEGYGLIGKFGSVVLNAPADEQAAVYQHIQPLLQQIVPDAPTEYGGDAKNMLLLGIGQATPEAQLFNAKTKVVESQSSVGKLYDDIAAAKARGETVDNSPRLASLVAQAQSQDGDTKLKQAQVDEIGTRMVANQLQAAKSDTEAKQGRYALQSKIQQDLTAASTRWNEFAAPARRFTAAVNSWNNGGGGAAETAMSGAVVQLLGSKRLNPALVSQYAHLDNGVDEFLDELKSKVSPEGKITMSPESIGRLANLVDYVTKEEVKAQNLVNNHYIEQANKYGVDPKDLLVPQTTDRGPVTLQKIEKWTAEARAARIPESDIAARMAKIKVQNGIR